MANVEILSPNERYNGTTAGVVFRDGVGRVDEENVERIHYFEDRGYGTGETTDAPPFEEWKPGVDDHSVPPGQRLQDALDPNDTGQPKRTRSGRLLDGLEEQNLGQKEGS